MNLLVGGDVGHGSSLVPVCPIRSGRIGQNGPAIAQLARSHRLVATYELIPALKLGIPNPAQIRVAWRVHDAGTRSPKKSVTNLESSASILTLFVTVARDISVVERCQAAKNAK